MALQTQQSSQAVITSVGMASNGGTVGNPTPVIAGTADAGSIVKIYDGIRLLGTAIASDNGTWSFIPVVELKVGMHNFAAIASDGLGHDSASSAAMSVQVAAPVEPVPQPVMHFMSTAPQTVVVSAADDSRPVLTGGGNGTPGDVVTVLDGSTVLGSTTVDTNGNWSFTPEAHLSVGTHSIRTVESNPSAPVITSLVDNQGPLAGNVAPGGLITDAQPTLNGLGHAGSTINVFDNGTLLGTTVVSENGTWSFTPAAAFLVGGHGLTATETSTGHVTSAASQEFDCTFTKIMVTGVTDSHGASVGYGGMTDGTVTITAWIDSSISSQGATFMLSGPGTNGWERMSTQPVLNGNTLTVVLSQHDWDGMGGTLTGGNYSIGFQTAAGSTMFNPDLGFTFMDTFSSATVPSAPVISTVTDATGLITNGMTTGESHPTFSGTGVPGTVVTLFDGNTAIGSTTVSMNTSWDITPTAALANGSHDIFATQSSAAGTSGHSADIHFTVNTSVPAAPVINELMDHNGGIIVTGGTTADTHPSISGTGAPGNSIMIYDGIRMIGMTKVANDGTWNFQPNSLFALGSHDIYAMQSSSAGTSAQSADIYFTVGSGTPQQPSRLVLTDDSGASIAQGGISTDGHPHISGTGTAGDVIRLFDNSFLIGSAVIDTNGRWTYTPGADLSVGTHNLFVTETNARGETSPQSSVFSFIFNPGNPVTPSGAPTAPLVTGLIDASGSVVSLISNGMDTADARPTLTGTGTAGDAIRLFDGTSVIGMVTVGSNGTWSVQPSTPLSSGPHDLYAVAINGQGTSARSADINFNVTVAHGPQQPSLPVLTDDGGAAIAPGSVSTDGHPHISGTGTAGDTIRVFDGSTPIGSALIDSKGHWTFTPAADFAVGTHNLFVTETNPAGDTSPQSDAFWFSFNPVVPVDPSAPSAPVITGLIDTAGPLAGNVSPGGLVTDGQPTLNGTGHAGSTINVFDNTTLLGTAVVNDNGTWSFTPATALQVGGHGLTATETNSDHVTSAASREFDFTFTKIMVTGVTDSHGASVAQGGMTDGTVTVTAWIDSSISSQGATFMLSGPGTNGWERMATQPVLNGNTLTVVLNQQDWNGLGGKLTGGIYSFGFSTGSGSTLFNPDLSWTIMDTFSSTAIPSAPVISTVSDATGLITNGMTTGESHPTFSGTGVPGTVVTLFDGNTAIGSATVSVNTSWDITPTAALANGSHNIFATQSSAAGTSGHSTNIRFTVDTSAPAAPVISEIMDHGGHLVVAGATTVDTHPSISGTGVPGSTITLFDGGSRMMGVTKVGNDGTWNFQPNALFATGPHDIYAVQSNSAGASVQSATIHFTVDPSSGTPKTPVISITDDNGAPIPQGAVSSDGHPHISGTGAAGDVIHVFDNFMVIGSAVIDGTGHWMFTPGADLSVGTHNLFVTETNSSNASSPQSNVVSFDFSPSSTPVVNSDAHSAVDEHGAFLGTAAYGNETVDLNADVSSYFKENTAHIQGSGHGAIDTLHLTFAHQVLDLTSLTGQTAAAKISGIQVFDLGGHFNNLTLSLTDVLNLGQQDLFQQDGHQQLMVKGSSLDSVDLSSTHISGVADGQWHQESTAVVGGVTYNVYEHSGAHAELLVQQGVQIALHN
ncbi:Ig-like domain-containing protein [Caballeronia sp. LjRoot31]|uniref:beta strand repeat-containing protein n=1 Tax=Caballeronia sp. LjRoot31 TaxID=3342324 RepID=UPI003ECD0806